MKTVRLNSTGLYKIINSNNDNNREGQIKPKYSLSELQKDFIASQLPKGFSFTLANEIDEKRQRIPKKTEECFETEIFKPDFRKNVQEKRNEKRDEKREDKKVKDKRETNTLNKNERFEYVKKNDEEKNVYNEKEIENNKNEKVLLNEGNNRNESMCSVLENNKDIEKDNDILFKKYSKEKQKIIQTNNNEEEMKTRTQGEKVNTKNFVENCEIHVELKDLPKNDCLSLHGDVHSSKGLTSDEKQHYVRLVSKLKAHKSSWPFRIPVDPIPQGVPNYLKVIHEPMDLKTIEKKLLSLKYEHPAEILGDINKIFLNSYKFNPKECQYYSLTVELEAYYHELLKNQEDKSVHEEKVGKNKEKEQLKNEQCFQEQYFQGKKKKFETPLKGAENVVSSEKKIVGEQEYLTLIEKKVEKSKTKSKYSDLFKRQLVKKIAKLPSKSIEHIVEIALGGLEEENATVELDFEKLPDEKIEKISLIVQNEIEKNEESKNNMLAFETRFSLF